ncbi:hypothetical protein BGZ63DRAFT_419009 [Mariannaea sp. PMI_226]|nr:hypothetical protein BGZ63DRAFT_419009 [Mariannaea sp. PMI_226]
MDIGNNFIDLTQDDDTDTNLSLPVTPHHLKLSQTHTKAITNHVLAPLVTATATHSSPTTDPDGSRLSTRAPISPPPIKRSTNIDPRGPPRKVLPMVFSHLFHAPSSTAPVRPPPPAANAREMAEFSGARISTGSQQVTPPLDTHPRQAPQPVKVTTPKARQSIKITTPKARQPVKTTTPRIQTPQKLSWDVPRIVESLQSFQQDIKNQHAQLTAYLIDSTEATERRVHTGDDLFAGLKPNPSESRTNNSMGVKFKQHKQHSKLKKDAREGRYDAVCIPTNEERVPRYRFHHVEIKKNVLTPNTMLTFVPHLRDLESSEETKYSSWLLELEEIDRKSGFKPMKQDDKLPMTHRSEYAATVSLYLDDWLEKLAIPGCNKSTLIRYMAHQVSDDAITPRQKTDILNSHRESDTTTSSEANEAASIFTEAFDKAFSNALLAAPSDAQPKPKNREDHHLKLRHVLLLDEAVDSVMDSKPTAKDGPSSFKDEDELAEYNLGTYCILGCVICYSHSCEHGEYDENNERRTLSITPRLSDLLKRRRRRPSGDHTMVNGHSTRPCDRHCYRKFNRPSEEPPSLPWSDDEVVVLRSILVTADQSKAKRDPLCLAADFLDRDCCDVHRQYELLQVSIPQPEPPVKQPMFRTVSWYDRIKKTLIGDWQDHTVSHEHQRRELMEPCSHEGPCTSESCTCVQNNLLCEKFCHCTVDTCAYKFTGCACHSLGKTCLSKQKDRPCICVQLNRECDPELCGTCGVLERADPENAEDVSLHSSGCQNCSLQRGEQKALILGQSQLEGVGYGLFTAEDIPQDDFIIEYVGELISHDEGVRREARRGDVFDEESSISYVFTLLENEGIWVDAATYGNLSRYINHASESDKRGCNITPRILYVNGEYRIKFTAMRDIKAGEELFFNYGENFPNLTKKLLDDKAGAKSGQAKKGRRPRADNGDGVARKAPRAEKKKPVKARATAPTVSLEDDEYTQASAVSNVEPAIKPSRKRKRINQIDSEEEEYHPTTTDATISFDDSQSLATMDSDDQSTPVGRLRKRKRQRHPSLTTPVPIADDHSLPKPRGNRGGARPGSGRPKKYKRRGPGLKTNNEIVAASAADNSLIVTLSTATIGDARSNSPSVMPVSVAMPKPSNEGSVVASPLVDSSQSLRTQPTQFIQPPRISVEEIQDSEEERIGFVQFVTGGQYGDVGSGSTLSQQSLDRGTRIRRPPAKFREEEQQEDDRIW